MDKFDKNQYGTSVQHEDMTTPASSPDQRSYGGNQFNTTRETVLGIFDDYDDAEEAVQALHDAGFTKDQIGFMRRNGNAASGTTPLSTAEDQPTDVDTDRATPVGAGVVIGGILGAAAALLIPGVGPVLAGGILAPVLGATAAGGAVVGAVGGAIAGGIVGGLTEMGIPEDEARYANTQFEAGRTIVTVRTTDRYDEAEDILRNYGAHDIKAGQSGMNPTEGRMNRDDDQVTRNNAMGLNPESTEHRFGEDLTNVAGTNAAMPYTRETGANATGAPIHNEEADMTNRNFRETDRTETRVPVHEEELIAHKQPVESGQVEIKKNVVEEQKTMNVPTTREEVHVEQRPVDRPATAADRPFTEETIRVPVREEKVTLEKQAHVTGEVVVSKERMQEQTPVSGTVRREEVDVNRSAGSGAYRSWTDVMPTYQSRWQQRWGTSGRRWEDYEPGYQFGYEEYNNPRYSGKSWSDVESDFRNDWDSNHDPSTWDKIKDSVRDFWEGNDRGA